MFYVGFCCFSVFYLGVALRAGLFASSPRSCGLLASIPNALALRALDLSIYRHIHNFESFLRNNTEVIPTASVCGRIGAAFSRECGGLVRSRGRWSAPLTAAAPEFVRGASLLFFGFQCFKCAVVVLQRTTFEHRKGKTQESQRATDKGAFCLSLRQIGAASREFLSWVS